MELLYVNCRKKNTSKYIALGQIWDYFVSCSLIAGLGGACQSPPAAAPSCPYSSRVPTPVCGRAALKHGLHLEAGVGFSNDTIKDGAQRSSLMQTVAQ